MAGAQLGIGDLLTFHLPAGMSSTTVRFALAIDGSYSSPPPGTGSYVTGSVGIQLGSRTAGNSGDSDATTFINRTFAGETVVRDGETVSFNAHLWPTVDGLVGRGAGTYAFYDLSHTARISLQVEPGVTFTSQSGRFLADVEHLASFTLAREVVAGCKTVVGRVTLPSPAPPGGVVVAVSDTIAAATAPATVTVAEGATSKSFTIKTVPVAANQSGTVTVGVAAATLSQPLTVRPMGLASLGLSPATVVGGRTSTGTVKLECNAGPGPVTVDLSTSNPAVAGPVAATVVVPQGLKSQAFTVATNPVLSKASATIAGIASTTSKARKLTVTPSAEVSPKILRFGSVAVGQAGGPLSATLSNVGTAPFSVDSIVLTGSSAAWFAQTDNCPASLDPGASCTIEVTFTALAAASRSAKVSIATSATSTPLSLSLSGTGI